MGDSLQLSCLALENSVGILQGTLDRLKQQGTHSTRLRNTLLEPKRVFELVSEYDLQRARLDLIEDVEPVVDKLCSKLEKSLNKLERERSTLQQTYELNQLRLNNKFSTASRRFGGSKRFPVVMGTTTKEELDRLRQLKSRKQALARELEELQAQEDS
ncbi:HEL173Cp [Eremothecium sinecaudum]|uniref:DASH complex subunit SPC19 n=1 Tax=Eremothecium sinecaudum TaxID=45286 RepID=A0A109V000_9SACH|nr:HEL173Cp [Eremothecium sinecaudum]AMD21108.1 HEL173Cp [Eremothecium sinecaudum]